MKKASGGFYTAADERCDKYPWGNRKTGDCYACVFKNLCGSLQAHRTANQVLRYVLRVVMSVLHNKGASKHGTDGTILMASTGRQRETLNTHHRLTQTKTKNKTPKKKCISSPHTQTCGHCTQHRAEDTDGNVGPLCLKPRSELKGLSTR